MEIRYFDQFSVQVENSETNVPKERGKKVFQDFRQRREQNIYVVVVVIVAEMDKLFRFVSILVSVDSLERETLFEFWIS